jgi:hypothetical protein
MRSERSRKLKKCAALSHNGKSRVFTGTCSRIRADRFSHRTSPRNVARWLRQLDAHVS